MKQDYTQLDAAILAAIKDGCSCAEVIMNGSDVGQICRVMESKDTSGKPAFRFLDARLQALRKRGDIDFCRFTRAWGLSPA